MEIRKWVRLGGLVPLLHIAAAAATTTGDALDAPAIPYEFCMSQPATDGKVYISTVFEDPLQDVRGAFAGYLGNSHGYRGHVMCYSQPSQAAAAELRTQEIEILHWRNLHHIVASDWTPNPDALAMADSLAGGSQIDPAQARRPD